MKIGDKVKFKNPMSKDKMIAMKVGRSTIKDLVKVKDQLSANKLSLMVGDYFKKMKSPIEVAVLDSNIVVPVQMLTLRENMMKTEKMQILENKLRKMVREALTNSILAESAPGKIINVTPDFVEIRVPSAKRALAWSNRLQDPIKCTMVDETTIRCKTYDIIEYAVNELFQFHPIK